MKNKGFTLVELLSVILLLAIIATISTVSIFKYLDDSKKELTDVEKQSIISAAKNWSADNISSLPSIGSNDVYNLELVDLVDEGYLNELSNYSNYYVKVYYSNNNYEYELILK